MNEAKIDTSYWKITREAKFQCVGGSKYEIVGRNACPVCHAYNIPVILVNNHRCMGIHRHWGDQVDCEGSFQSL